MSLIRRYLILLSCHHSDAYRVTSLACRSDVEAADGQIGLLGILHDGDTLGSGALRAADSLPAAGAGVR